ncbi:hypothetical protein [Saccharicrinis aurantiacus]|uniref:hypothetical protein n=1 Tax=Saccharicrinis aurantiacus TaxID=1849719 RepID=UPI0008394536|nr:hypothetical protein [Saccharicrinis aurantiacus]
MKSIYYILGLLFSIAIFVGCDDYEYEPISEFSDAVFYTSYGSTLSKAAGVGEWESFMDVSQGAIYHTWSIDSGNYFLEGTISNKETDLEQYIVNPGGTQSDEKTINIYFQKGDTLTKIRLFNVYEDSVGFRDVLRDENGLAIWDGDYVPAVHAAEYQETGQWAGKWVFDYNIVIDVYDTIVTDMVVRQDGVVIDHTVADTIDIMVGDVLQFQDLSAEIENTSRPDSRTWQIRTIPENPEDDYDVSTSSTQEIADITFKMLGDFNMALISKRASSDKIPGDSEEYIMPLIIRVNQSDQPFVQQGTIREQEDGTLMVPFNAVFAADFNSSDKDHFTIYVEGYDPISITSISIPEDKLDYLQLTLASKLYPEDVATLEYTGTEETSSLISQDLRPLQPFLTNIKLYDPNLLDYDAAGFEDALGDVWIEKVQGTGTSVEYSTNHPASGNSCLKMQCTDSETDKGPRVRSNANVLFNLDKDVTYTVRLKRYVTNITEGGTIAAKEKIWFGSTQLSFSNSFADFAYNEWVEFEFEFVPEEDMVGAYWDIQINPGLSEVYYDDLYVAVKTER